jgi:hypothetical protein
LQSRIDYLSILITALGVLFGLGAIISSVILFRQSKQYESQREKEKLEHTNMLQKYESIFNASISEWQNRAIEEINNLPRHDIVNQNIREMLALPFYYVVSKFAPPKDILLNFAFDESTILELNADLSFEGQDFTFYIEFPYENRKSLWIAIAGNYDDRDIYQDQYEAKKCIFFSGRRYNSQINIYQQLREMFPQLEDYPTSICGIRLRGSQKQEREIAFTFKFRFS